MFFIVHNLFDYSTQCITLDFIAYFRIFQKIEGVLDPALQCLTIIFRVAGGTVLQFFKLSVQFLTVFLKPTPIISVFF